MPMVVQYAVFCPLKCKGWRRIGAFSTIEEAQAKMIHHLTTSDKHMMSAEDAQNTAAGSAEFIALEEVDDAWDSGVWHAEPYAPPRSKTHATGKGDGKGLSAAALQQVAQVVTNAIANSSGAVGTPSSVNALGMPTTPPSATPEAVYPARRLGGYAMAIHSITKAEAAARSASRMAAAASRAFDEEARVLDDSLRYLKDRHE